MKKEKVIEEVKNDRKQEEEKEILMMLFLESYSIYKPARITKDKINSSLAKFWDSDIFWYNCAEKYKLFENKKPTKDDMKNGARSFWHMLHKGLPKKGEELVLDPEPVKAKPHFWVDYYNTQVATAITLPEINF